MAGLPPTLRRPHWPHGRDRASDGQRRPPATRARRVEPQRLLLDRMAIGGVGGGIDRTAVLLWPLLAIACARGRPAVESLPGSQTKAGAATSAPEGETSVSHLAGSDEVVEQDCLSCHTEDVLRQQRLTPAQWSKSIDKMRKWGAPIKQEDVEALAGRLAATYGRAASPYRSDTITADKAAALFVSLPDGQFAGGNRTQGRVVYADHCEPCHGGDGRGGDLGTCLSGQHVLDRAPELAVIVRSGRGMMPSW